MPKKITKEKGEIKYVDLVENPENASDALKRYYGERTAQTERIITSVYNAYLNLMQPTTDFL